MLRFLHPRWLVLHACVLAAGYGMVYAGRWQWEVASRHHDIRNYAYSVQWYVFVAFAVGFWLKIIRDAIARGRTGGTATELTPSAPATALTESPPYLGYAMPQSSAITVEDSYLARYNEHLTALAADSLESEPPVSGRVAPDASIRPAQAEGRT